MNWTNEIANLMRLGCTIKEIAAATGLSLSAVYDLKNGHSNEPRGMAAVNLHDMILKAKSKSGSRKPRKVKQ